jgi:hypothetical protein
VSSNRDATLSVGATSAAYPVASTAGRLWALASAATLNPAAFIGIDLHQWFD